MEKYKAGIFTVGKTARLVKLLEEHQDEVFVRSEIEELLGLKNVNSAGRKLSNLGMARKVGRIWVFGFKAALYALEQKLLTEAGYEEVLETAEPELPEAPQPETAPHVSIVSLRSDIHRRILQAIGNGANNYGAIKKTVGVVPYASPDAEGRMEGPVKYHSLTALVSRWVREGICSMYRGRNIMLTDHGKALLAGVLG